jgi:hypothetical protein
LAINSNNAETSEELTVFAKSGKKQRILRKIACNKAALE